MQILQSLQFGAIAPVEFRMYSGFDLYHEEDRNRLINLLIDNVISQGKK